MTTRIATKADSAKIVQMQIKAWGIAYQNFMSEKYLNSLSIES